MRFRRVPAKLAHQGIGELTPRWAGPDLADLLHRRQGGRSPRHQEVLKGRRKNGEAEAGGPVEVDSRRRP